jgi:hypothetical protein
MGIFVDHLFLSYASADNQSYDPEEPGWITKFQRHLETRLQQILGAPSRVWRDRPNAPDNAEISAVLDRKLREIASMVAIVSPSYLSSRWCSSELKAFTKWADETGGLVVNDVRRIIKVVKEELSPEIPVPRELRDVQEFEFLQHDPDHKHPIVLELRKGNDPISIAYRDKLNDLAYAVRSVLKALGLDVAGAAAPMASPNSAKVFLAESTSEFDPAREQLSRELGDRGHVLLPRFRLPYDRHYESGVEKSLEEADLSVHVIGLGGLCPEPADKNAVPKTAVEIQARLAEKVAMGRELPRLFFLPAGLMAANGEEQSFLSYLTSEAPLHGRGSVEVFQGALEQFKLEVDAKILELQKRRAAPAPAATHQKKVYFVCTKKDLGRGHELAQSLNDKGLKVTLPPFADGLGGQAPKPDGDITDCDGLVLLHSGDIAWLRENIKSGVNADLGRPPGRPLAGFILCDGPEAQKQLEEVASPYPGIRADMPDASERIAKALLH